GNGFLEHSGLAWARVQWQGPNGTAAPINPTVPATAQGGGEVIVRDFGLLLRGADAGVGAAAWLPELDRLLLAGVCQSAWFVDTTAYTDFYRVRASLFNSAPLPANLREYDVPNAHASGATQPPGTPPQALGCAAGATPIPAVNPLDGRPYTRAAVLGLARRA